MSDATTIRVGLLGCGNVGSALVRLIAEHGESITARTGLELEVARTSIGAILRA